MINSRTAMYAACLTSQMLLARMPGRRRVLAAMGAGAALMFLLDPTSGRRRRALLRDRTAHWARKTGRWAGKTRKRLTNQARGALANATRGFFDERVRDEVLVERVREELGHVVAHPRHIDVSAAGGHVILIGEALEADVDRVRETVPRVRGVRSVDYRLMTPTEPPTGAA